MCLDVSETVETNENGAAFRETGMLPGSYSMHINLPKGMSVLLLFLLCTVSFEGTSFTVENDSRHGSD